MTVDDSQSTDDIILRSNVVYCRPPRPPGATQRGLQEGDMQLSGGAAGPLLTHGPVDHMSGWFHCRPVGLLVLRWC